MRSVRAATSRCNGCEACLRRLGAQSAQADFAKVAAVSNRQAAIGGMPDHVHLLVRLHTTTAIADLVKEVKGASSHRITHEITPDRFFKWQGAYGAFTLCKDEVSPVRNYIERQREHHAEDDLWADSEQTATAEDEPDAER